MILKSFFICKSVRNYCAPGGPVEMAYKMHNANKKNSPIIIMHGILGSKQNWGSFCRSLEKNTKQKIIAVDARNHGESPHTNEFSTEFMALDIIKLMKDMNIEKSYLLGHSMGGLVMMYLALKYPQYVKAAVIADVSPLSLPKEFTDMRDIFLVMKEIVVSLPAKLSITEERKLAEKELSKFIKNRENMAFILLNLKKTSNGSFTWSCNVEALYNHFKHFTNFKNEIADLEPYKGPTMFICGKRSSYVDPKSWPDIQKLFPNSEIHWLDSGHLVHIEQASAFLELLIKFLNK